jgi:hypothetical protein
VAGVVGLAASVAGSYLVFRGLWDAQPLVTFGELPTDEELQHGRRLLLIASAVTVAGGGLIAASGNRLHGALVALPAPTALALTYVGPANRGFGWAGLVLGLVAIGAALRVVASRDGSPA